ncbi:MAG: ABC transporter permease [Spirochaetaceae bacterium]|nr:MAG: ABC transporter permease [Spirochaetaceae bacterium]
MIADRKGSAHAEGGTTMMAILFRILRRDATRNRIVNLVILALVGMSAFLLASGGALIVQLATSLDALFERAMVPHLVQMHAGELDRTRVETWAAGQPLVDEYQIVEMVSVDGSHLVLGEWPTTEDHGVMDISFVAQNERFDFLLDGDNRPMLPAPGEIGVPLYYREARNLAVGDRVRIDTGSFSREFRIAEFVRDAMMNPSIIHSKRFLVNPLDYAALRSNLPDTEYLIEFRLTDASRSGELATAYTEAGLPDRGPSVDHRIFRVFNALTDGMVAAVVVVLSLLLMLIAVLCLRFTIVSTIEEDYRQIGVMKAIGMGRRTIQRVYLIKYVALGGVAALGGYLASLAAGPALTANITAFLGSAEPPLLLRTVPMIAALIVCAMVVGSAVLVLRRVHRISAVEALRSGAVDGRLRRIGVLPLRTGRRAGVNLVLGVRDVTQRPRLYALVVGIFALCAAIILVPFHFHSTMNDPSLIAYMGIGRSDIRIDLRQTDLVGRRFDEMVATVAGDPQIARSSPLVTARFTLVGDDGTRESIAIETGDFSLFPLEFVMGEAPRGEYQIALSVLKASDLDRGLGDSLMLLVDGEERTTTVSGIYQDVTNGGRTAKAPLPVDDESVLWYSLIADVQPGVDVAHKTTEYSRLFHPARVTDLNGYIEETLGQTITQLAGVVAAAIGIGLVVAILITALFLKMVLIKDTARIAIMKSVGFSLQHIRLQYQSIALALLLIGVVAGTVLSNTLGERAVGLLWSFMGAAQIRFVIRPLHAYLLLPLLLAAAVGVTTLFSVSRIRNTSIATTIVE